MFGMSSVMILVKLLADNSEYSSTYSRQMSLTASEDIAFIEVRFGDSKSTSWLHEKEDVGRLNFFGMEKFGVLL